MRILRSFLRPQWLLLLVVVVGFAVACFWVLAPWQLGKNTRNEQQNDLIKHSADKAPVPVDQLFTGVFDPNSEWRQVTVTGSFLPDKQAVVRLRSVDGSPAYEVLTPLRAADGRNYLVNRGFVRPTQGTALPHFTPAPDGQVTVTARIRKAEGAMPGREPRTEAGALQVYSIDPESLATSVDLPLAGMYLEELAGQPGALGEIPLPQIDSGPYLSYGLQWIAFGVMAPLGLGYFAWSEIKHRRAAKAANAAAPSRGSRRDKAKQTRATLAASSTDGLGGSDTIAKIGEGADRSESTQQAQQKLADRYGS